MKLKDMDTEEHINNLYNLLKTQGDSLERQNDNIERLLQAFLGDKELGFVGVKEKVEQNRDEIKTVKERVQKADERFTTIYQRVIGISMGVTFACTVLLWVFQNTDIDVNAEPVQYQYSVDVPEASEKELPDYTGYLERAVLRQETEIKDED